MISPCDPTDVPLQRRPKKLKSTALLNGRMIAPRESSEEVKTTEAAIAAMQYAEVNKTSLKALEKITENALQLTSWEETIKSAILSNPELIALLNGQTVDEMIPLGKDGYFFRAGDRFLTVKFRCGFADENHRKVELVYSEIPSMPLTEEAIRKLQVIQSYLNETSFTHIIYDGEEDFFLVSDDYVVGTSLTNKYNYESGEEEAVVYIFTLRSPELAQQRNALLNDPFQKIIGEKFERLFSLDYRCVGEDEEKEQVWIITTANMWFIAEQNSDGTFSFEWGGDHRDSEWTTRWRNPAREAIAQDPRLQNYHIKNLILIFDRCWLVITEEHGAMSAYVDWSATEDNDGETHYQIKEIIFDPIALTLDDF